MGQLEITLKTYCDREGVSVEDIISDSKSPEISQARKNISRAMAAEERLDYKIIALKLKMSPSAVWTYLNTVSDKKQVKNCLVLDFTGCPEIYDDILSMADEELREPEKQAVWIFKKIHKKGMAQTVGE